ncbi:MAG: hypothetical protein DLM56_14020 [Pseudonocardiales bacterium]|nr:MAG: hypothetical protein DLM56_14020 [Pseudonocardiales bacterium]
MPALDGVALVAVGSLGRREVMPFGDVDLLAVHSGQPDVRSAVEQVWYPLWDAGIALDHSVRTADEAIALAGRDLAVALGLLAARPIGGDTDAGAGLRARAREAWRRAARTRLEEVATGARERADRFGELAFLVEPDLKQAAGGLRDTHALHALAVAQLVDEPSGAVADAERLLLDVRTRLHLRAGRALDRLVQQEQEPIAVDLGFDTADRLLRAVSDAGRMISFALGSAIRRIDGATDARLRRDADARRWRPRRAPARRPVGADAVEQSGEVVLARGVDPHADPVVVHAATITTELAVVVDVFHVVPRFGSPPDADRLAADLRRALSGQLSVDARLRAVERSYPNRDGLGVPAARALWFDDAATDATVLEVRAGDSIGLLHRVTAAMERSGLQVRDARVSTLGRAVVDSFYVVDPVGRAVVGRRQRAEAAILAAVGP